MGNSPSTPAPETLTERNVGDQSGKVGALRSLLCSSKRCLITSQIFVITGATSGVGLELAKILYGAEAKVWLVARSNAKVKETVTIIRAYAPRSTGTLETLLVDFNDLRTIKPAVEDFLRRESRIDVLWNNAGIMIPPKGTKSAQGYEAQLGINALAPFLFTKLLTPTILRSGARVVWVSSSAAANFAPSGGVDIKSLSSANQQKAYSQWQHYGMSKAALILYSAEFGRKHNASSSHKVVSVALDPGNLSTNLYTNMPKWQLFLAKSFALKPAIYGAYTELYAGLSPEVTSGGWVVPWGKISTLRKDIEEACKPGGVSTQFWEWSEAAVMDFVEPGHAS